MTVPAEASNFDITVLRVDDTYIVEGKVESRDVPIGVQRATLGLTPDDPYLRQLLQRVADQDTSLDVLRDLGTRLFAALFPGEIGNQLKTAWTVAQTRNVRLRLRLRLVPPEVAALPWELLYWPRESLFLATDERTPVVRFIDPGSGFGIIRDLEVTFPLRMLVLVPPGSNLETGAERTAIERAMDALEDNVQVRWLGEGGDNRAVTAGRVGDVLATFAPHVVHFIGHGRFDPWARTGELLFNDEDGKERWLSHTTLKDLFAGIPDLRLLVLNACEGGRLDAGEAFLGIAPEIMRAGIPAVAAMQYPIRDDLAIVFGRTFYQTLMRGTWAGHVDAAVARARRMLRVEDEHDRAFGTPVLFLRAHDGIIFRLPQSQASARSTPRLSSSRVPADECDHLRTLLRAHQNNLRILEQQIVLFGLTPPLHLVNARDREQEEIARIERQLRESGCE